MTNSQNGWPVDRTGANQDRSPIYGNVAVPNGVLEGDVAIVLRWVAKRFHETVQPLVAGTCWGWFVKNIEGSASISNHASGTAIDLNADQHPMDIAAGKNFTPAQIAACHAIIKAAGGVVRWGGDYTGRPDPMHWEIVGSRAATAALARKINSEEDDDMPTVDEIAQAVWAYKFTRPDGPDANGNKQTSAGAYQAYSDVQANSAAAKVINTLTPVIKGVDTDETAVAATVVRGVLAGLAAADGAAETIASAVVAALPPELAREVVAEIGKQLSPPQ